MSIINLLKFKMGILMGIVIAIVITTGCVAKVSEKQETIQPSLSSIEDTQAKLAVTNEKEIDLLGETYEEIEYCDETLYIDGDLVNIRKFPSTDSEVITKVSTGIEVQRVGKGKSWSKIRLSNGTQGYMSSQYLSDKIVEKSVVQTEAESSENTLGKEIGLDSSWKYAEFSKINSGTATLYKADSAISKDITVCVNAGHGTKGGESQRTQCHPDGTAKVTGGTTTSGSVTASAISSGMTFIDSTAESKVTLAMAKVLKKELLARGYNVLMIREDDDVQLDNIARTVIANNIADCHIALHWDSTTSDKGAFFMSIPDISSYKNMEPVKSHWQQHDLLGNSLISGLKAVGTKIFSSGSLPADLTQTSYSTIASVDIELGDKASDYSTASLDKLAIGLADGVDIYFN